MSGEDSKGGRHVLVVGGGIGGITAALELASCGVRVTVVEAGPSIGGRMIQLDKTFPTLDCSTCTLSPKMVEVAMHKNVELMSLARPVAIRRRASGFEVEVLKKARFVDTGKCNACGACSAWCPVVEKSEFDMGTGTRKAVYIPFPQAVPNKASIHKRAVRQCKAACMDACPVHTNVPGYLKHISEGRADDAYLLIRETNPFPSVCGRVCYAPCEKACNRGQIDASVAIRDLKRFAADNARCAPPLPKVQKTGKKIAVIGAGPAGLACAHDLALLGHAVTVFEAMAEPGGMLRYAVPEYRLPKSELVGEIDHIVSLGVDIRCGVEVGRDVALPSVGRDCDALFIGTGAPKSIVPGVPGEGLPGVIDGLSFLSAVEGGDPLTVGRRVLVIGGGNTAVDCARTARRLGSEVVLVYRRTREEMPALEDEVDAMAEEGVAMQLLVAPVGFTGAERLEAVECVRMEPGEPDSSGRRRPVPVEGSFFRIEADTAITALGQTADTTFAAGSGLSLRAGGTIEAAEDGATALPGVFAGGDVATGPAYVIDAIAAGKRAASAIDGYLSGRASRPNRRNGPPGRLSGEERDALSAGIARKERQPVPMADGLTRAADFREVSLGYGPEAARLEASRCLAGMVEGCIECGECERRCEAEAIDHTMKDETIGIDCDAVVLATGFDLYDPTEKREFGYGTLEGVVTAIEFERICSVTGPTGGEILISGRTPRRFFFIQCVGSRDRQTGARFCSRVCCMYTAKHARMVMERIREAEVYVSYIDVRAYGKGYEEFYKGTQEAGARYIRGIPGEVTKGGSGLVVRVEDMLSCEVREIEVDVVVLATGVRPRPGTAELCGAASIELDEHGFVKVDAAAPSRTSVEGIFVCGMASGPKDVPDTVASAGEAAAACMEYMGR